MRGHESTCVLRLAGDASPLFLTVALQAALLGEPFPWFGSWNEKLYYALRVFGLSAVGVRHKTGRASRGGKDIWWNEDGTMDFVDSDDIART